VYDDRNLATTQCAVVEAVVQRLEHGHVLRRPLDPAAAVRGERRIRDPGHGERICSHAATLAAAAR
jgi:hypothetical protein